MNDIQVAFHNQVFKCNLIHCLPDMEPGTAVQTAWCASTNEPPHLLLWFESLAHGADGDEEVE